MTPHPGVPWVEYWRVPGGFAARCTRCAAQGVAPTLDHVQAFAMQHREHQQAAPTHYGAGDLVARATGALGIKPCAPCKQRQAQLNGLLPRIWPRRG